MHLQEGIVLDVDEEMGPNGCSTMTDEQFDTYRENTIRKRYQRVPIENISSLEEAIVGSPKRYGDTKGDRAQKYSKKARQVVIAARGQGKNLEYKTVLNHMIENNTDQYTV